MTISELKVRLNYSEFAQKETTSHVRETFYIKTSAYFLTAVTRSFRLLLLAAESNSEQPHSFSVTTGQNILQEEHAHREISVYASVR